jgi:hypothetical protein
MREELRDLQYHVYGLSEADFEYALDVARRLVQAHLTLTQQRIAPYRDDPEAVEAIDDEAYYAFIDTVYLWEYGLWRLQGVFEGLITNTFLPTRPAKPLPGLKKKLEAMRAAGYTIADEDYAELLEWASLRNALSHSPPEQYRPAMLKEADLLEYKELVERVCRQWRGDQVSGKRSGAGKP